MNSARLWGPAKVDYYLTAGTDEVSMGMVKRVVERAHRGVLPGSGSCELEPE